MFKVIIDKYDPIAIYFIVLGSSLYTLFVFPVWRISFSIFWRAALVVWILTPMDRSTKQKINKETQTLNDTIDQLDLMDIYRTFHPKTMNFTFFSSAHGTFSRIDHILGHKSSLGKF